MNLQKSLRQEESTLSIAARRRERLEKLKMEIGEEFPQIEVIVKATDLSVLENVYQFYKDLKMDCQHFFESFQS